MYLKSKFDANKEMLTALTEEKRIILNQHELEAQIIQSLLMDEELELILNQRYDEVVEDEYTYEDLLALEDQIGYVSKGLSEEQISNLSKKRLSDPTNCSICLILMSKNCLVTLLKPCGHVYHVDCITQWLSNNKTCPLCLQEIEH